MIFKEGPSLWSKLDGNQQIYISGIAGVTSAGWSSHRRLDLLDDVETGSSNGVSFWCPYRRRPGSLQGLLWLLPCFCVLATFRAFSTTWDGGWVTPSFDSVCFILIPLVLSRLYLSLSFPSLGLGARERGALLWHGSYKIYLWNSHIVPLSPDTSHFKSHDQDHHFVNLLLSQIHGMSSWLNGNVWKKEHIHVMDIDNNVVIAGGRRSIKG